MERKELCKKLEMELNVKQEIPVVLTWERAAKKDEYSQYGKITMYHNCDTGVSGTNIDDVVEGAYHLLTSNSRTVVGLNLYYSEEYDVLVIIACTFITNRPTKEGAKIRHWKESEKFFIFKDKSIYGKGYYRDWYQKDWGCVTHALTSAATYGTSNINFDSRLAKKYAYEDPILMRECQKMFPAVIKLAGNKIGMLTSSWILGEFLTYTEPTPKSGPKQRKIDELVSIKLPAFPKKHLKRCTSESSNWYNSDNNYAIISKVKDGVCVVRTFKLCKLADKKTPIAVEGARMYIEGNNVTTCRTNNYGEWVNMPSNLGSKHWNFKILEIEEGASEGTSLQYLESILTETKELNKDVKGGIVVWALLKYPYIEMLYKAGWKQMIANYFSNSSYLKPDDFVRDYFGGFDPKKKSLFAMLGINKYQFSKMLNPEIVNLDDYEGHQRNYMRYRNDWMTHQVREMKRIFDRTSIADIDDTTYDTFLEFFKTFYTELGEKAINGTYYNDDMGSLMQAAVATYGVKSTISSMECIKQVGLNIQLKETRYSWRIGHKYYENPTFRLYRDYMDLVRQMEDTAHFKLTFKDISEVKEMHDAVVAIFNMKKNEYKNAAFEKSSKRCDKFQYADEKYSIVIPRLAGELANEGMALHHCVGGYVDRVCRGETNIVFIRKVDDIETPFFTVEISNDGSIQQIHGSCNRNLSSEPELEYFVKDWIKACKLIKTDFNKVR